MQISNNNGNDKRQVPQHVAIIMDGNRRWAKERNLPSFEGHKKGYDKMRSACDWFFSRGVKYFSVFAFSTENWQRAPEEVNFLMRLIREKIDAEIENALAKGYQVLVSGRIDELPGDLPEALRILMEKTRGGQNGIFNICLNYGGRAEIVDAIKKMMKNNVSIEQIHEGMVKKYLYNDLPDPDIIARTSGESRLSGFQLWQSAYSELLFLKKYWPEFEEQDAEGIIKEFGERQRRFGGA